MLDEISEEGEWWFAHKKELRFEGKLTFSPSSGGSLVIYGSEEPFIILDTSIPEGLEQDKTLISGQLKDGRKVTLVSNIKPGRQSIRRDNYSFAKRSFKVDFILIGHHFENFEDIKFESITVQYANIDKWLNLFFDHEITGRSAIQPTKPELGFMVEFYYGKPIKIEIENQCRIEIFSYPVVSIDYGLKDKINDKFYVKFRSLGEKKLDNYISLKGVFQDFLNFVMTYEVFVSRIIGEIAVKYNDHTIIEQIQVVYRSTISERMDKIKVISPFLPIFKFGRVIELQTVTEIIRKWFDLKSKILAVYDLYFGVMYNYQLYLTTKFLMLAQALEIYVGIKSKEDESISEKGRQIDALVDELNSSNLSDNSKEWITDLIRQKRSLSFKEKMRYIYERYSDLLPDLSSVIGTKEQFSSQVVSYRNNFTHGNIDYDQQDDEGIFWKFKDIQLILQLCILSELGYSIEELKRIFSLII